MTLTIRFDDPATRERDHATIDALWRTSLEERTSAEEFRALEPPRVSRFPTVRFILGEDANGRCVAMAGSVLPGADAVYGFEQRVGFPHPALPTAERSAVGEGLTLYVDPALRRGGLGHGMTFFSSLLVWDAGGTWLVAENGAVSLAMAQAAGMDNTGVVTMHRKGVPYYLTVGRVADVLERAWPAGELALAAHILAKEPRAMLDRWLSARSKA